MMIAWCAAGSAYAQSMDGPMDYMVKEIAADFAATADYTGVERADVRVMAAMRRVPREEFVPDTQREAAYFNRPLSIGHGQTISQPFIVALMTHFLIPQPTDRVLEIGTGSGYQAAVLGELVHSVYTVEIIPELAAQAAEKLEAMGYDSIHTRVGDGWHGWPEEGPYDGIIITAAGPDIPPLLVQQLKPGGRMVLPLGEPYAGQMLTLVTKEESGEITTRDLLPVTFVPLTGEH
jgi:protein-L-isoaspartate(D-aspartate) O-methyltransferase